MSFADFFASLWTRVKAGGGLFTTPTDIARGVGNVIKSTGSVVGETAKNLLSPLLPILAVLVLVYAFGSTR